MTVKSVLCSSHIVANTVVVVCKHFVPISLKLHYRSALVLVPLKNPTNLGRDEDTRLLLDKSGPKHDAGRWLWTHLSFVLAQYNHDKIRFVFRNDGFQHFLFNICQTKGEHWIIWGNFPLMCLSDNMEKKWKPLKTFKCISAFSEIIQHCNYIEKKIKKNKRFIVWLHEK